MKNPHWFKNLPNGYGLYPAGWPGWLIYFIFILALIFNIWRFNFHSQQILTELLPQTLVLIILLLVILKLTGEKIHWHWKNQMLIIYTTFPDTKTAQKICRELLDEKLIICANFIKIESHYLWDNKIHNAEEIAAILKSTNWNYSDIRKRLTELHPYEKPSIIKIKGQANQSYFEWLLQNIKQ